MAITTDNEKLATMEYGDVFQPAIPINPGALGQDDLQQLLWDYPGILFTGGSALLKIKRFLLLGVGM